MADKHVLYYRDALLIGTTLVWNDENRPRYDRRGQIYPSDLTNEEWTVLEPLLPVARGRGRPRTHMLHEVMNGIRYVQRYGIPWDAMPKDLPPGSICYDYWRVLTDGGHLDRINHLLVMADREKAGREASPTLAIVDAQSVKCDAPQGDRGYDAAKKVVGRKRHIAVDTDGTPAGGEDYDRRRSGSGWWNTAGAATCETLSLDQDPWWLMAVTRRPSLKRCTERVNDFGTAGLVI